MPDILPNPNVLVSVLDFTAVALFAVTGALVASRKQMDIFGFAMLGTATGIGGGTLRDVLLGAPVFWVQDPIYLIVCILASSLVFFTAHLLQSRYRAILWLDAIGLSFYCVVGAAKAATLGVSPIVAIVMGTITATFGGILRDVLGGEVPLLLRRDVYVTAAFVGAGTYVAASATGMPPAPAWLAGVAACFSVRALALTFNWSLPTYRARPGRTPEELAALGLVPTSASKSETSPAIDDGSTDRT